MRVKESAPSQLSATPVVKLPNAVTQALGAKLRSYRELAQKSQEQLAHDAEVERSRISKLENGHINPSLLTLATLCHCLGITLAELFDGVTATLPPASQGGELRRRNQAHAEKIQRRPKPLVPITAPNAPRHRRVTAACARAPLPAAAPTPQTTTPTRSARTLSMITDCP